MVRSVNYDRKGRLQIEVYFYDHKSRKQEHNNVYITGHYTFLIVKWSQALHNHIMGYDMQYMSMFCAHSDEANVIPFFTPVMYSHSIIILSFCVNSYITSIITFYSIDPTNNNVLYCSVLLPYINPKKKAP
jgi:hypothetical protein